MSGITVQVLSVDPLRHPVEQAPVLADILLVSGVMRMYDPDGNETDCCPHASVMVKAVLRCEGGDARPEAGDILSRCNEK